MNHLEKFVAEKRKLMLFVSYLLFIYYIEVQFITV